MPIPGIDFSERVIDTWGAWSLEKMPKALVVAGAGASGSEIASAYARLGDEVTLVEMLDQVLPAEDKDMARVVERQFKKDGIEVMLGTKVEGVTEQKTGVKVQAGGKELKADHLAIAGGRRPDTDPLNLDAAGVKTEENGRIAIDEYQRTSADGVYAIGDLVRGPALAHKASEEAVVAVEHAAGQQTHPVDVDLVAGATFCHPQVASVGMTEEQAKEAGKQVKVGKFKLGGAGASVVYDDRAGLVKIVGDSGVRRDPGRPHRRQHRLRHDQRAGERDGARGRLPRARAHHPPAPDDVRGDPGRRPRRRGLADSRVGTVRPHSL